MKNGLKFGILTLIIVAVCVGLIIFFATRFPVRNTAVINNGTTNTANTTNTTNDTDFPVDTSKKFVSYQSELLNVDFSKYVIESYGKIEEEDYAKTKFKINPSLVNELKTELGSKMSANNSVLSSEMALAKKVKEAAKNMTSIASYSVFKSGKVAKTREINLFLFQDNNDFYLFIYG